MKPKNPPREWDVGKLKHEPFYNDQQIRPTFEPSGSLAAKTGNGEKNTKEQEREKPSFEPTGKLAKDTNTYKGVLIKYNEPPEAKLSRIRWRMYPFKGDQNLPVIYVHRQSAYLIGKDRKIADFPVDHPSCSRQHAALQYRSLPYERADGSRGRRTRPYIIDLSSANGTYLNNERIDPQRYYELKEKDVLRFGFSSREFVLLNEDSLDHRGTSDESEDDAANGVDINEEAQERLERAGRDDDDLF